MSKQIEAMKLALEALEDSAKQPVGKRTTDAITALREALAEQPAPVQQEPVAWQFFHGGKWHNGMAFNDHRKHTEAAGLPVRDLYPSPQAQPVCEPLTDEEIYMHCPNWLSQEQCKTWVRQIEAAHGIKGAA